jgi:hypothetical protein
MDEAPPDANDVSAFRAPLAAAGGKSPGPPANGAPADDVPAEEAPLPGTEELPGVDDTPSDEGLPCPKGLPGDEEAPATEESACDDDAPSDEEPPWPKGLAGDEVPLGDVLATGDDEPVGETVRTSSGSPISAITVLTGTVVPGWTTIRRTMPAAGEGTSIVPLSISTISSGSSRATVSPSFLSHSATVPSSMVRPSIGMVTGVAMSLSAPC